MELLLNGRVLQTDLVRADRIVPIDVRNKLAEAIQQADELMGEGGSQSVKTRLKNGSWRRYHDCRNFPDRLRKFPALVQKFPAPMSREFGFKPPKSLD